MGAGIRLGEGRIGMAFDVDEMARRLRMLRASRNVSQQQVAEATGLQQSSISNWEKGSSVGGPSYQDAWLLADYYGVSIAELGGRIEGDAKGSPMLELGA